MGFKFLPNNKVCYFAQDGHTEILVKASNAHTGTILGHCCPKELVGKKVRLCLEVVGKQKEAQKEADKNELYATRMV